VAAGMGVSLIPDLALVTVRDDVIIREIAPRPADLPEMQKTRPSRSSSNRASTLPTGVSTC